MSELDKCIHELEQLKRSYECLTNVLLSERAASSKDVSIATAAGRARAQNEIDQLKKKLEQFRPGPVPASAPAPARALQSFTGANWRDAGPSEGGFEPAPAQAFGQDNPSRDQFGRGYLKKKRSAKSLKKKRKSYKKKGSKRKINRSKSKRSKRFRKKSRK
jgi:hypothetical protein